MNRLKLIGVVSLVVCAGVCPGAGSGERASGVAKDVAAAQQLVILDTDIGDDIDDAFALALVLRSPEIKLLGVTTEFGDTALRARLLDRFLGAAGQTEIPVATGKPTPANNVFTQRAYAQRTPDIKHPDGVQFILDQIKAHPGEITLIAIGPLVNVGEAIKRDPATFKKVKRVVMMGGSVYRGYDSATSKSTPPQPEWNIARDPEGAKALLASGVPVYMMPLDSTQIHLEDADRERIFAFGSPLTDQLALLYHQWVVLNDYHGVMPTLFDPVAAAYAVRPDLCPATPLRLQVDEKGMTKPVDGPPNAEVCVHSDEKAFLDFYMGRVAAKP